MLLRIYCLRLQQRKSPLISPLSLSSLENQSPLLNAHLLLQTDHEVRPDCNYLGTFVQDITNLCSVNRENPKVTRAGGQEFETEGYNVIVRQENCGW